MAKTRNNGRQGIRVRVEGRVQGVGFRYFAQTRATALGLSGYVRNTADGAVELEASGEQEDLEQFARILQKGPGTGRVEHCTIDWLTTMSSSDEFQIRS